MASYPGPPDWIGPLSIWLSANSPRIGFDPGGTNGKSKTLEKYLTIIAEKPDLEKKFITLRKKERPKQQN